MPPDPPDPRFDLCTRPWIPVDTPDGITLVGLRELLLRAHEFADLAVTLPPAASGLMRMLYAVAARLTDLNTCDNRNAWTRRRYELLREAKGFDSVSVEDYLSRHQEGLFLFDPARPFLQDPRLVEQSASRSGVNKLVMARPAGNNPVFFGHFTDDRPAPLPSADAVLHLIAQLYYGPSGQCTPRTVNGERYGNTMGGPLRRALSFHPQGQSLFHTLVLGIPTPANWPVPGEAGTGDGCPWERREAVSPLDPPRPPAGPLSMLTEQYQHVVLLEAGERGETVTNVTITWALRSKRPEGSVKDPYLIWDEGKDGIPRPRDADAERALWRDLDGLVLMHRSDPPGRRPPIVDGLTGGQLPAAVWRHLRVTAYGFDQDGQTRDRTYFTATTPPVLHTLLSSQDQEDIILADEAREARIAAEKAAARLRFALRIAWRSYTTPFRDDKPAKPKDTAAGRSRDKADGPWSAAALTRYWPAAERHFWHSLHTGAFPRPLQMFGRLALDAYDEVTRQVAATPRGAKAREEARGLVRSLLKPVGSPPAP